MKTRNVISHFLDGTAHGLEWPGQTPKDFLKFSDVAIKAMESPQPSIEVKGGLIIIKEAA